MSHAFSLGALCFGVWLLLSGHYQPLTLGLGLVSCALVVAIVLRMDVVDREGYPLHLTGQILGYWPWLVGQIVLANLDVARRILHPDLPISPVLVRLRASQRSDLGRVIYANSITLTPGTVATRLEGDEIEIHALSREAAETLREGEMDRRATRFAGEG